MFEKEVEEYVDKHYRTLVSTIGSIRRFEKGIVDAILYFTEPRERQIAELKAQIEKMKCCAKCSHCNTYITTCIPQKRFVRLEDVCEDFELR